MHHATKAADEWRYNSTPSYSRH